MGNKRKRLRDENELQSKFVYAPHTYNTNVCACDSHRI